jgi:hypothetical protein
VNNAGHIVLVALAAFPFSVGFDRDEHRGRSLTLRQVEQIPHQLEPLSNAGPHLFASFAFPLSHNHVPIGLHRGKSLTAFGIPVNLRNVNYKLLCSQNGSLPALILHFAAVEAHSRIVPERAEVSVSAS